MLFVGAFQHGESETVMGFNRTQLNQAISKAKTELAAQVKKLGDKGKDAKLLRKDTAWRQLDSVVRHLNKRVAAIDKSEKIEADLVAARAIPKVKVPKAAKAAPAPKAKKPSK